MTEAVEALLEGHEVGGYTLPPIQRGIIRLLIERPRNRSMLADMVYQLDNDPPLDPENNMSIQFHKIRQRLGDDVLPKVTRWKGIVRANWH
jgi:hypothetical protein